MSKLENKLGRTPSNIELVAIFKHIFKRVRRHVLADISSFNMTSLEDLLVNKGEYNIDDEKSKYIPEEVFEEKK